jgi:hypothetical protein
MCPPEQETQMRFGLGNVIGPIFGEAGDQATAFPAGAGDRGETTSLLIGDGMLRPKAQLNLRNAREYFVLLAAVTLGFYPRGAACPQEKMPVHFPK